MTDLQNRFFSVGSKVETMEDVKDKAPAVFSKEYHPNRSSRYSFLSTEEILDAMIKLGWKPSYAKQTGKNQFGRHLVRLENDNLSNVIKIEGLKPQIIVDNSHDGFSQASIHAGIFRLICTNGLVASIPGMYDNFKFKHVGINAEELKQSMERLADNYSMIGPHLNNMMNFDLTREMQEDFAIKAVALREPWRFMENDKVMTNKVTKLNDIKDILTPKRGADQGEDLWRTFNVIQEKLVNGGYKRLSDKGRASKTRALMNPGRDVNFNKGLWELAESYLNE